LAHIIEREADNRIIKEVMSVYGGEITITANFGYVGHKLRDIPTLKV